MYNLSCIFRVSRAERWKVKNCSLVEIFRGVELVIEAACLEPRTQVAGTVLVVDFDGLTLSQVWQFTPHFAKLVLDWIQVRRRTYKTLYKRLKKKQKKLGS